MAQRPSKRHRTGIFALKGTSNSVSNDISSNKPSTPTAVTADMIEVQPDDALQFLIQPKSVETFTEKVWERQPKLYPASKAPGRAAFFKGLCDLEAFQQHVREAENPLEFGVDLNASRFVDGVKEMANGKVADSEAIAELWREGCTLQVVQPQRWEGRLLRLVAALEGHLGCLVGANAYLTPPSTQGLAPHHDAVELFVCQTAGSKRWRLYKPVNDHALPALPSGDLEPASLGEPIAEYTLQVGDVLYMPKGTVHQAVASAEKGPLPEAGPQKSAKNAQPHSAHITLSTYNRWAYSDLLDGVMRAAEAGSKEKEASLPLRLRRGLPFDFLMDHGLQASLRRGRGAPTPVASQLAAGLRKLANDIEARPDLVDAAADDMAQVFMRTRAPPLAALQQSSAGDSRGPSPKHSSMVAAAASGCFRLVGCSEDEMREAGGGDEDVDGGGFVRLVSCLHNQAQNHMMAAAPEEAGGSRGDNGPDDCCGEPSCEHKHPRGQDQNAEHAHRGSGGTGGHVDGNEGHGNSSNDEDASSSEAEGDSDAESEVDELVLPAAHAAAAAALLGASRGTPLAVRDVALPTKEERLTLAHALWDIGAVRVVA